MFVISTNSVDAERGHSVPESRWRTMHSRISPTVMKDVTLSTGMGAYLNMLNSYKPRERADRQ